MQTLLCEPVIFNREPKVNASRNFMSPQFTACAPIKEGVVFNSPKYATARLLQENQIYHRGWSAYSLPSATILGASEASPIAVSMTALAPSDSEAQQGASASERPLARAFEPISAGQSPSSKQSAQAKPKKGMTTNGKFDERYLWYFTERKADEIQNLSAMQRQRTYCTHASAADESSAI